MCPAPVALEAASLYWFYFRFESAPFEFFLPARRFVGWKFGGLCFRGYQKIAFSAECRIFSRRTGDANQHVVYW